MKKILGVIAAAAALALAPSAWAQAGKFPEKDKTIRIVVPFAAGGGVDSAARQLANQLGTQLGVPVIVDNRAGANGTLGGKFVQTAPADGYTLLFSAATHVMAKQVIANPPYDPQSDFAPVARVGEAPLMLVITPTLEPGKLGDLLGAVRAQPDRWTAGIPAAGAPSHLAMLLMAKQGNLKVTYVPYKGTQPALIDVAGGHTSMLLDSMISLMPLAKAGKVKPIAITSGKRSPLMPDVPTARESGLPNFTYASWYGVWAPKDTPADRVNFLNTAINRAVAEVNKAGTWATMGVEPVSETVDQFRRFIAADVTQSAELLKSAGFKPE